MSSSIINKTFKKLQRLLSSDEQGCNFPDRTIPTNVERKCFTTLMMALKEMGILKMPAEGDEHYEAFKDMKESSVVEKLIYTIITEDPDMALVTNPDIRYVYYMAKGFPEECLKDKASAIKESAIRAHPKYMNNVKVFYSLTPTVRREHYIKNGWALAKNDPFNEHRIGYYKSVNWKDNDWYADKDIMVILNGIHHSDTFVKIDNITKIIKKLAETKTGIPTLIAGYRCDFSYLNNRLENGAIYLQRPDKFFESISGALRTSYRDDYVYLEQEYHSQAKDRYFDKVATFLSQADETLLSVLLLQSKVAEFRQIIKIALDKKQGIEPEPAKVRDPKGKLKRKLNFT